MQKKGATNIRLLAAGAIHRMRFTSSFSKNISLSFDAGQLWFLVHHPLHRLPGDAVPRDFTSGIGQVEKSGRTFKPPSTATHRPQGHPPAMGFFPFRPNTQAPATSTARSVHRTLRGCAQLVCSAKNRCERFRFEEPKGRSSAAKKNMG